ncbi:unnamed protein product [Mytilus coruscus]|uniref:Uncharacterized protein n=1 Tax=Mytilus coruscus TaxID=42192 RepID=A0A6J7ZX27_MYTCO|nr:unnamed protein product [Mytilus coruscus]
MLFCLSLCANLGDDLSSVPTFIIGDFVILQQSVFDNFQPFRSYNSQFANKDHTTVHLLKKEDGQTWKLGRLEKISEKNQLIFDQNFKIFSLQHLETKTTEKQDLDDKIFEQTETSNRDTVLEAVQLISSNLLTKSKKFFGDYLNGGKYSNQSKEMILTPKSCPANNITLERRIAQIDRRKTIAPNTSISTINSKLMFRNNRAADWLKEKPEEQKILL